MMFTKRPNLPPGSPTLPLIGSLHLGTLPHQNLAKLAKKYGPLMYVRLGQKPCIVASSPAMAMEVLKHQDANFSARPPIRAGQVIFFKDILFESTTPTWRHLRRKFQSELTGPKQMEVTRHVREEEMAYMLHNLPQNGDVDLRRHLGFMFSNIISRITTNKRFLTLSGRDDQNPVQQQEALEFKDIVEETSWCLAAFNPRDHVSAFKWLPDFQGLEKRFKRQRHRTDVFVSKIIVEHVECRGRGPVPEAEKDMVDLLLDDVGLKDEYEITLEHVKGIIWDASNAGTYTPSLIVEWGMSELVCHANVMKKAQTELDAIVGRDRRVQESDIPQLKYIQAIMKETFRLHPPSPVMAPHMAMAACQVAGYDIPANTRLSVNIWAIGRDESIWEDPLEFHPERFLEDGRHSGVEMQGKHFELLPFGAGRRACPGQALGTLLVNNSIANLLHAFDWSPPLGKQIEDIDMSEYIGLSWVQA